MVFAVVGKRRYECRGIEYLGDRVRVEPEVGWLLVG
jgi:hypothetical protein